MTLSNRNHFFRAEILINLILLVLVAVTAFKVFSWYPPLVAQADSRPPGLFQALAAHVFEPVPWASLVSMLGSLLFAIISLILILYYFEKTPSPEILFISFFVFSLTLEAGRIMLPLAQAWDLPGTFNVMAQRILLFGRYAGIFSLFAAGICAAGLEMQRQGNVILVIILAGLAFSLSMPLNSLAWDTSLCLESGYGIMFAVTEIGVAVIASLSFFVSAQTRGAREYIPAGVGSFLAFLGRTVFLHSDTWVTLPFGLALLALGTWLVCGQLHRVYLWL
ncbi:MAG: hypothetical protein LBS97_06575 [Treponema sp.]|jgi:hypothetical protein|nr:hypothetical protein [Treponema sp.]